MKVFGRGIFLVLVSLLCYGCPEEVEHDLTIKIENNSNDKIVFFAPIKAMGKTPTTIDTLLTEKFPWGDITSISNDDIVNSNSKNLATYFTYHIQDVLDRGYLHFYVFNYDSLTTIPWNRIRDEYIVAKRIDFDTWEELKSAEFTVTYP